jgi:transcriptional regulator with XRE-family HTH domain
MRMDPEDSKQLVRLLRSITDLDKEEFAAAAGIPLRTFRRYGNGETVPSAKSLEQMARVADGPLSWVDADLMARLAAEG